MFLNKKYIRNRWMYIENKMIKEDSKYDGYRIYIKNSRINKL
jgi:hypothetical protein